MLARGPSLTGWRQDLLLVAVLTTLVEWDAWRQHAVAGWAQLVLVLAFGMGALAVAMRRTAPLVFAAAVTVGLVCQASVTSKDISSFGWFLVIVVALYSVAVYATRPRALAGLLLLLVGLVTRELRDIGPDRANPWNPAFWMLLGLAFFGFGLYVKSRRQARRLRETSEQVELSAVAAAHSAVAEERARIAQELHDVVAQDVSAVVVQATAAEALLDQNPAEAREAIHKIQAMGREALAEMRQLLGILDANRGDRERAPQPTLAGVQLLIERQRALGLPVNLSVEGAVRPLPPGLEVSAYRVVQEALTNVRKHAPQTTADVTLRYGDSELVIRVENDLRALADDSVDLGQGLVGMAERVRFFGGRLQAGPMGPDRFVLEASFPTPSLVTP